jgi:tRNA G10  N-methylase Trm11
MSENKKKYAYWMKPSMVEEITEMLGEANATSKSDFVCQAVKFYIAYLHQQKCIDYLSPILAQTIKSEIESVEKNVSEMLFKVAVEQAKVSNVIAATNQFDSETMSRLNDFCANEVARNNGIITFETAYDFQRG